LTIHALVGLEGINSMTPGIFSTFFKLFNLLISHFLVSFYLNFKFIDY